MNVLKHGDSDKIKQARKIVKFVCEACDCEFEANPSEYEYDDWNDVWVHCICPECGTQCDTKVNS